MARQFVHHIGVFFTPWGEALIRHWYQEALAELTGMPHVRQRDPDQFVLRSGLDRALR